MRGRDLEESLFHRYIEHGARPRGARSRRRALRAGAVETRATRRRAARCPTCTRPGAIVVLRVRDVAVSVCRFCGKETDRA